MTSYTNLSLRMGTAFAVAIAAFGGLFITSPVHADYGAQQVYGDSTQVCSGRYDPNCIVKQTNYLNATALPYQQQSQVINVVSPTPQPVNIYSGSRYQSQQYVTPTPIVTNYNSYRYVPTYYTPSYSYNYYSPTAAILGALLGTNSSYYYGSQYNYGYDNSYNYGYNNYDNYNTYDSYSSGYDSCGSYSAYCTTY